MASALERAWYRPGSWAWILLPLSWLFRFLAARRRRRLQVAAKPAVDVPVVVVGNIAVGGTGKTPLLLSIIQYFRDNAAKPAVISRGYGGKAEHYPCPVSVSSTTREVGDEPMLFAGLCPVVVDPERDRAARYIHQNTDCSVIFSDDGLQHYALRRDVEIAVIDGGRGFGNGYCLPAGPLREPPERLREVDMVVVNGRRKPGFKIDNPCVFEMEIAPVRFRNLASNEQIAASDWTMEKTVHAVAGIGNPQRFANTLRQLGLNPTLHAHPDHHNFSGEEFRFEDDRPVIITAKDAVKCRDVTAENVWVLDIEARLPEAFFQRLQQLVEKAAASKY